MHVYHNYYKNFLNFFSLRSIKMSTKNINFNKKKNLKREFYKKIKKYLI